MKSIYNVYNENVEIVATPANTTGMGNPMAPTDTENGSEPIVTKRKKRCKKCVKEGLLSGQDATLKGGANIVYIIDYINFLAKSKRMEKYDENDINVVVDYCLKYNVLSCNKPGEIVFDNLALENINSKDDRMAFALTYALMCAASGIDINTKFLPKSIKKITFKDFDTEVCLDVFGDNDLSSIDFDFPNGHLRILPMNNDAIIKLGKVNCNTLYVRDNLNVDVHPKGISLKSGSTIQILDLSGCRELGSLIGKKLNIGSISLNPNFVEQVIRNSGFANQDTRAWVVSERYR
jgi:hypothetical protein